MHVNPAGKTAHLHGERGAGLCAKCTTQLCRHDRKPHILNSRFEKVHNQIAFLRYWPISPLQQSCSGVLFKHWSHRRRNRLANQAGSLNLAPMYQLFRNRAQVGPSIEIDTVLDRVIAAPVSFLNRWHRPCYWLPHLFRRHSAITKQQLGLEDGRRWPLPLSDNLPV
jgi:hypothetical protein